MEWQLKHLLAQIQNDWNSLKDKLEIDIVEKYANNVRIFTISLMGKREHKICSNIFYNKYNKYNKYLHI